MSEKVHFLLETNNPISGQVKTFVPKVGGVVGSSVEGEVPAGKPRSALLTALQYALFVEGDPGQVFSSAEAVGQVGGVSGHPVGWRYGRAGKRGRVESVPGRVGGGRTSLPGLDAKAWQMFWCCRCSDQNCTTEVLSLTGPN